MTGEADRVRARAHAWLAIDPDPETRAELEAVLDDDVELARRFGRPLTFGTAGLRGPMGAGPAHMNRVVVRRATAGLMAYLPPGATVVVGHDSRRRSDVFAADTAGVVAGAGGRALVLPPGAPTPLVAFAVRELAADAGVVVTASHNPPSDNGYKVYLADGAQIIPPVDAEIARAIDADAPFAVEPPDHPAIVPLGTEVEDAYLEHVVGVVDGCEGGGHGRAAIRVVYSALHGVGARLTTRALRRAGFSDVHVVERQREPDGSFPTVAVPNPELDDALAMTRALAEEVDADVALVHDPDADRLGVLVPDAGSWHALSGNQIGLLLADHVLRRTTGPDRLVVDTVVSSRALGVLAAAHGVHHERTLTGFKWIVRPALAHPEWRFVFGYEEALGFSVDPSVRDKDAISAALVFADLVAERAAVGESPDDRLEALAAEHGLFATASWVLPFGDAAAVGKTMDALRTGLPERLGESAVVGVHDYASGGPLPPTDLLELALDPPARLSLRPSGTEPKLKVYAEVVVPVAERGAGAHRVAVAEGARRLEHLRDAILPLLQSLAAR